MKKEHGAHRDPAPCLQLPLPQCRALAGAVPHLLRADAQDLLALPDDGKEKLAEDMTALADSFNISQDNRLTVPGDDVEVVITKKG